MLLTRLPLTPKDALDLHVLSLPPAFVLSQDQTLKLNLRPSFRLYMVTLELTRIFLPRPSLNQAAARTSSTRNVRPNRSLVQKTPRHQAINLPSKSLTPKRFAAHVSLSCHNIQLSKNRRSASSKTSKPSASLNPKGPRPAKQNTAEAEALKRKRSSKSTRPGCQDIS